MQTSIATVCLSGNVSEHLRSGTEADPSVEGLGLPVVTCETATGTWLPRTLRS